MDDLSLLRKRIADIGLPVTEIAAKSGVKPRWLHSFVAGNIPEPGYKKIVAVRRCVNRMAKRQARAAA